MKDLLMLYRNYIFAIQERQEYGDRYGDTDELMQMYEEQLKIRRLNENNLQQRQYSSTRQLFIR